MADRHSLESAPTVVSDAAGPQPGNLKGNPAISASPSYDTKAANATSPALHFPFNYFRVIWEFCVVIVLLPYHFVKFALFPSTRWRRSWTLLEASLMPAVKRIMAAMDLCGFKISSRDTDAEPSALGKWWMRVRYNGARFEWVEGLPDELVNGELADKEVKIRRRVGMFGWTREDAKGHGLIGLYLHGGGELYRLLYHFSAWIDARRTSQPTPTIRHIPVPPAQESRQLFSNGCVASLGL